MDSIAAPTVPGWASPPPRRRPIPALTGLRFLAALHVIIYHEAPDHIRNPPRLIGNFLNTGHIAVGLFFVLSGFILVYNYAPGVDKRASSTHDFLVARFARIYPVYLLGVFLALPRFWQVIGAQLPLKESLARVGSVTGASLLLIQSWFPSMAYELNGPGWSLSAEAFFYVTFPLTLLIVMSTFVRKHWIGFTAVLWASSLAIVAAVYAWAPSGHTWLHIDQPTTWLVLVYAPLFRLPEFIIGMVMGAAFLQNDVRWSSHATTFSQIGAIAIASLIGLLTLSPYLPDIPLHTSLLTPLFGIIIVCLAVGNGYATKVLSRPIMVLLGEASYSMYILHRPLHTWLRGIDIATGMELHSSRAWLPVYLLFVCSVSVLVLRYIEEPARVYVRRRFSRSAASIVAPAKALVDAS